MDKENGLQARERKTECLQLMFPKSMLETIENWRFANRIGARAQAIRLLIEKGLEASAKENDGEAGTSTVVENTFTHEVK